jgi:hypothetical protein
MTPDDTLEYGVCMPAEDEALSSWVSRLALAQGCTLREMLEFLELQAYPDIDAAFVGNIAAKVRQKCRLPRTAFQQVERANTTMLRRHIPRAIRLRQPGDTPRFRYCPLCLRERSMATLPYFWRFREWRYCPDHCCLMEDRCWNCNMTIRYPREMATSQSGRDGYGTQRRCMRCSADLGLLSALELASPGCAQSSETEELWMVDGCVQVNALFASHLSDEDWSALQVIALRGALPTNPQWASTSARLRAARFGSVSLAPPTHHAIRENWVRLAYFVPEEGIHFRASGLRLPTQVKPRRAFQVRGEWWCRRELTPD